YQAVSLCAGAYFVVSRYFYLLFFFFQAEDGIRDLIVTGVQTCALPISHGHAMDGTSYRSPSGQTDFERFLHSGPVGPERGSRSRSEERRVGKECRSRWGPDH